MRVHERQYIRVEYHQEVRLETAGDLKLLARSENICAGGLGIICDQVTAYAMMPMGYQVNPDKPLLLSIELQLGEDVLQATCCVQNSYRLAQESFCFNLKFMTIGQDGEQQLDRFMKKQKIDV
jgi:hypothetical protein